jgi:hypothetical protein
MHEDFGTRWGHAYYVSGPQAQNPGVCWGFVEATTGIEPVDRSNRSLEPNIDLLLLLLMIRHRWGP